MRAEGIAVVTGAGRGIGRATALALAARGFEVVATMRDASRGAGLAAEAAERGLRVRVERLDVTDPGDFAFPDGLRVLVNNAGVRLRYLPVEETPAAEWREVFETNVFGLIEVTRRAIPVLRAAGAGVVCNVGSAAMLGPLPFFGSYVAGKAAVGALSEILRLELAPFGIRVVEVLPGPIDTDLLRTSTMFRPPDAVEFPAYRAAAERLYATRLDAPATPAADAAEAIADAILDDGGPLRYGCDPVSRAALDVWRASSDEDRLARAAARLAGDR